MHPQIESMFDEAEKRYLKPEELGCLNQYVDSIPARLEIYRYLRDHEVEVMQQVADNLEAQFSEEPQATLERCLKNALLILRYSAMGMLLNDETFLHGRLITWLEGTAKAYQTEAIDQVLYQMLNQRLSQLLSPNQVEMIKPHLQLAEGVLVNQRQAHAIA
ncbi:MAG: hypothetical protein F6K30_02655 [Cyanothece sp. SIO2G6]|nr:hypothetical protein [Cyanothece sp. SIO2G6]